MSKARTLVLAVIIGAVAFGLFLGYLAYASDSFPAEMRPFGDYASVVYSSFNGTEFAFRIQWNNASYLPLYAQLTSPATDAANTPVCEISSSNVQTGKTLFLPFTISPASATLSNVNLSIAVQLGTNGPRFTITYNVASVDASNAPITPSDLTCQQPLGS